VQRWERGCSSLEGNSLGWIGVVRVPNTAKDPDSGWDTKESVAVVGCGQSSRTPSPALGALSPLSPLPPRTDRSGSLDLYLSSCTPCSLKKTIKADGKPKFYR
jgi:hypothetical protein